MDSKKKVAYLVADTSAFIRNAALQVSLLMNFKSHKNKIEVCFIGYAIIYKFCFCLFLVYVT